MKPEKTPHPRTWTRRAFLRATTVVVPAWGSCAAFLPPAAAVPPAEPHIDRTFSPGDTGYTFDTGELRGALRHQETSGGIFPLVDGSTGTQIARETGLLSHYRLLDAQTRYGTAAWDWTSRAQRLSDGSVQAVWAADQQHPFQLEANYRWANAHALDVTTTVTARRWLPRFESFVACYFQGFPASFVYVQAGNEAGQKPKFFEAKQSYAHWQMFPRDAEAVKTIQDGRWTRPPHPVQWRIGPRLAAPLVIRRDPPTRLAGLAMAPMQDCFAVATPYGEDDHRSFYLSLFGCDLQVGQQATARCRLVVDRDISDQKAVALYEAYLSEI